MLFEKLKVTLWLSSIILSWFAVIFQFLCRTPVLYDFIPVYCKNCGKSICDCWNKFFEYILVEQTKEHLTMGTKMIIPFRPNVAVGIKCGMRHPKTGLSEDDLSRLTGSSSTVSTPSHDNACIINDTLNHHHHHNCPLIPIISSADTKSVENASSEQTFNSTYLPEIIDPLEWQKSRKRKERLDSTSSQTQERKLIRSNSEELLSTADCEVIRRVASHEDFQKKPLQENRDENILKTIHENDNVVKQHQQQQYQAAQQQQYYHYQQQFREMARPVRIDTSPARSHRVSPHRDHRNSSTKSHKENENDSECEHEKRRSSERFCKSRAPPGRKSGNYKKSSKYSSKYRGERDENTYKYDISAMKHERRGFVSKFNLEERVRKEEAADGEKIHDYNDNNNLIDFRMKNDFETANQVVPATSATVVPPPTPPVSQAVEPPPWDSSSIREDTPVLCRRFAPFDEYGTDNRSKLAIVPPAVIVNDGASTVSFRSFAKNENFKTRLVSEDMAAAGHFQSPDERLKSINKRLTALKKRITQLEENFERTYGYRPSQVDKFNDKQIKNVLAEMSKLRKEKHDLKTDPMMALGLKISGGLDPDKKLIKMKETLKEIEMKLTEKRKEGSWSESLDSLTAEQLVLEKTAVQHSLLYLESLYGRPTTRDERDVVRPLYDRYRIIKRLVTRSLSIAGTISGIPELPTILEHEAMAFTVDTIQPSVSLDSTDTAASSPEQTVPILTVSSSATVVAQNNASNESLSDSGSNPSPGDTSETPSGSNPSAGETAENIHTLSVDELWEQLERARDAKKELKRVIKDFEALFEVQSGRKMLKSDRRTIEDTYFQYKQKKAKVRLLQALIKKQISN